MDRNHVRIPDASHMDANLSEYPAGAGIVGGSASAARLCPDRHIPWGISESAYYRMDEAGNYQYYAFGVPHLAASKVDEVAPVISPYSSFLALHVDAPAALHNLRRMQAKRWAGSYGLYEAIDFHPSRRTSWLHRFKIARCWMTHHQGMSLLSVANFLDNDGAVLVSQPSASTGHGTVAAGEAGVSLPSRTKKLQSP